MAIFYEILSVGDGEILYETFQAVARIFNLNDLQGLIKAGFLIGVIIACFNYMTDMKFTLAHVLIGFIVYSLMFVPKATVVIEDVYSGQTRTADNIPLGIAMPISIISTVGVKITLLFESSFSLPDQASLVKYGYMESLKTLLKLRNIGLGTAGSNAAINGDLSMTLSQYLENCAWFDIRQQMQPLNKEVTEEKLLKATDLLSAIKTTFINIDTMVYLPTVNGQKTCFLAYKDIADYMENNPTFKEAWDDYLIGVFGLTNTDFKAEDAVGNATQALALNAVDSQTFMRNALIASYLRDGPSAFITRPGMEQLKVQWSSEQTFFNQFERPLMAFIEMFTVACAPIIAFLVTMGPFGISLVGRYFQMLVWISLWNPIMAICNLYIIIVTTRALELMQTQALKNGADITSMVMHDQLYNTLETWLATGGMLASSVPAISLMLVYGGTEAVVNMAGRMTNAASSNVKPDRAAPDPMTISPSLNVTPQLEHSPNVGTSKHGVQSPTINFSQEASFAQESARQGMVSASKTASSAASNMQQTINSAGTTTRDGTTTSSTFAQNTSHIQNWVNETSNAVANRIGKTSAEKQAIHAGTTASLNASLGGNIPFTETGAKTSVQAQLASNASIDGARQKEITAQVGNVLSSSTQDGLTIQSGFSEAQTHATESAYSNQEVQQQAQTYQAQLAKMIQASQSYSEKAAESNSFGESSSLDYNNTATRLDNAGLFHELNNELDSHGAVIASKARKAARNKMESGGYVSDPDSVKGDTLKAFLALKSIDPDKARSIASKAFTGKNNSDSSSDLKPGSYKNSAPAMDKIVSPEQARDFDARAGGMPNTEATSSDVPMNYGVGLSDIKDQPYKPVSIKNSNRATVNKAVSPKRARGFGTQVKTISTEGTSDSKDNTKNSITRANLLGNYGVYSGRSSQTTRNAVEKGSEGLGNIAGNHDQVRNEINNAPLIDPKQNTSHLIKDAAKNQEKSIEIYPETEASKSLINMNNFDLLAKKSLSKIKSDTNN